MATVRPTHATPGTSLIPLHCSNQRVLVWDISGPQRFKSSTRAILADVEHVIDIETLRVQHHISGVLSGTLPQVGQQNVFLGLPLILMPEEVVLLVRNRISFPS